MSSESLEERIVLPTLEKLGVTNPPTDIDVSKVLAEWSPPFFEALTSNKVDFIVSLFLKDGIWRDLLALTWDLRTIVGHDDIRKLLNARLEQTRISNIRLSTDPSKPALMLQPTPDMIVIQAFFDFETSVGLCSGIFRLVPTPNGGWKLHTVFTNLDELKNFPPLTGLRRDSTLNNGAWAETRAKEMSFEDQDPQVIIVGAGHAGIETGARLKYGQGMTSLIVERNARVGDNWRDRYDTLCLHDPVWYGQTPYLPFPKTWPIFPAGKKLGDWFEAYAQILDLNVWTSSEVTSIERDDAKDKWVVTVLKGDGSKRVFRVTYVVLAFGFLGGIPNMPRFPGMDTFKGKTMHSVDYKRATDFKGKKVVVIGACTSAHDICQDCVHRGIDVTMVQRSSTCILSATKALPILAGSLYSEQGLPVESCDLINASFPSLLMKKTHQRLIPLVREVDKELREGLDKVGFKRHDGPDDSGFITMVWEKGRGYYIDVGACQLVIDGKIKLKHGSVAKLVESGVVFEDGSSLDADIIVCATGFGNANDSARKIFPDALVDKMKPIWGLTNEGEMQGLYTECGLPNVHVTMGNLALCRFYSMHVALLIKAKEEGLYTTAYNG